MAATLADGLQIVPGYRLEVCLGKGGFGEVWRAIGPGKVPVALKIIAAKGSQSGEREFKSLELLRDLRHPNLLPIQACWLLDDDGKVIEDDSAPSSIVIAMLLGGKNLRQRLEECRKGGIAGIPPHELLDYLRDAAKGIDFLNKPIHKLGDRVVAIQHRDIKPENLMIVGGGVMVADFGIAGVMEAERSHTTNAAMTVNYAAPELFDYTATAWTDQYALAISYGELRCGSLPFPPHSSPMHVIRIHTESRHDFSRLSPGEQSVLKRATCKVPEQRYPTCMDMIADLEAAVRSANLLDVVLPLHDAANQSDIPTELQATRLDRGGDTDQKTAPMLSAVTSLPGLESFQPAGFKTVPIGNSTEPVHLPATQPDLIPRYAMPATTPLSGVVAQDSPARRTPWIEYTFFATVMIGLITWSLSGGVRNSNESEITNRDPVCSGGPPVRVTHDETSTNEKPSPAMRLSAAREQAAAAAKEKRYSDVVKALEPVFEQASATSDDSIMRGNSYLALADAGESPAENYARAAVDFQKAELPREQLRALTRQGHWLVDHNFPKEAIAPLRQAIALKKSADLQETLCQALFTLGDAKAARDEAVVALAELPKELSESDIPSAAKLHHVAARACLVLGKQADADPDSASRVEPLDLEAIQHFQDALALATTGKLDERTKWQDELSAFRKLTRMVAREERRMRKEMIAVRIAFADVTPNDSENWLKLAELEQLDNQTKSAMAHFALGYSLQALTLARAGKLEEAIESEVLATKYEADVAAVFVARALISTSQKKDREAVKLLDEALARTPMNSADRWQLLADRASTYARLAAGMSGTRLDWDKSHADYELAVSLNPMDARLVLSAGQNLLKQGRQGATGFAELLDRAATVLATATTLDAKQAEAHFSFGECQLLRGKNAEAQAAFEKAIEHAADEPMDRQFQFLLNQSLAFAYLRAPRDDAKALAAAEKAISLQKSDAAGHFARGLALRNLKRVGDSISAFNDTIAVQPKHVGALLARGQLTIESQTSTAKQIEQATQDIETALAAATTDEQTAEAHYVRSLAALKTHVSNITQAATAESALLKAQRDLLQAVKLVRTNTVYSQAATELFEYAAKFTWSEAQRKTDSDSLQRDLKALRAK